MLSSFRRLLIIFTLSFLVFNSNLSAFWYAEMYDTIGSKLLPFALWSGKGLDLSDFADQIYRDTDAERYFIRVDGRALSWSPPLSGIIAAPFYAPYVLWTKFRGTDHIQNWYAASFTLEKITASLMAAMSVVLMYWWLGKFFPRGGLALMGTLIFALGTQVWSTNSQFLWSHGPATLLLLASLLCFGYGRNLFSLFLAVLAGFARYPLLVYPVLLTMIFVRHDQKHRGRYVILLTMSLIALIIFHSWFYGDILGPYADRAGTFSLANFFGNLAGILFSPGRGLLWYTPYALSGIITFFFLKLVKGTIGSMLKLQGMLALLVILVISTWNVWWGGASFGDRLLSDIAVPVVFISIFTYSLLKSIFLKGIFWLAVVWSVGVHALGAFSLGVDAWNFYPVSIDEQPARVWDYRDTPIRRTLATGFPDYGWHRLGYLYKGISERVYNPKDRVCELKLSRKINILGYRAAEINFTNLSKVPLVTSGANLIRLRAIFRQKETGKAVTSPLADRGLPAVISPGQTVKTTLLLIPPGPGTWRVTIMPVQEGYSWWGDSCSLTLTVENL